MPRPGARSTRWVRPARLATAALAVLLVSGCGQNAPGVAAQVGDDRITDAQVDELAEAICILSTKSPQAQAQGGALPAERARFQALQILLETELAGDLIDPEAVDKKRVAELQQQTDAEVLPARLRGTFEDAAGAFLTSQLGLAELGRQSLAEKGTKDPDEQTALAEGQRLRDRYARRLSVSVDPRFGAFEKGQLQPADGSLSVAVSDEAKAGVTADGTGGAAADVPANLSCSNVG